MVLRFDLHLNRADGSAAPEYVAADEPAAPSSGNRVGGCVSATTGVGPRPHFPVVFGAYVSSLLLTSAVLNVFGVAQPALLYIVPLLIGSMLIVCWRNDTLALMWAYSEAVLEEDESADESLLLRDSSTPADVSETGIIHPSPKKLQAATSSE